MIPLLKIKIIYLKKNISKVYLVLHFMLTGVIFPVRPYAICIYCFLMSRKSIARATNWPRPTTLNGSGSVSGWTGIITTGSGANKPANVVMKTNSARFRGPGNQPLWI